MDAQESFASRTIRETWRVGSPFRFVFWGCINALTSYLIYVFLLLFLPYRVWCLHLLFSQLEIRFQAGAEIEPGTSVSAGLCKSVCVRHRFYISISAFLEGQQITRAHPGAADYDSTDLLLEQTNSDR